MRGRAASLTLALAAAAALCAPACSPNVRDGWYACSSAAECPSGFSCQAGRCARGAPNECRIDLNCDDSNACTLDVCEGGLCLHEPEAGDCDDGDFCNGPDTCASGACTSVGPAPCPDVCTPAGCGICGTIGGPCCDGFCAEGTCDGTTCQPCGATGQACCPSEFPCNDFPTTCDGTSCVPCGGDGEPCCGGGLCGGPYICLPGSGIGRCGVDPLCATTACPGAQVCVAGNCYECGGLGAPCCADSVCMAGTCNRVSGFCEDRGCGAYGEPCCTFVPECDLLLACVPSDGPTPPTCLTCGQSAGDPCCPPTSGLPPCMGAGLRCDIFDRRCR